MKEEEGCGFLIYVSKEELESLGLVSSGLETISLIYLRTACPADIGTFLKSTVSVNCDLKSLYFKTHYN